MRFNWRLLSKIKLANHGDTIVEVMLAISIFALALVVSLTSTNRSLHSGTDATNRQQALTLADQQVEFIKNALGTDLGTGAGGLQTYTNPQYTPFCIDTASGAVKDASSGSTACNNFSSQYNISITPTTSADKGTVFKVNVTWPSTASNTVDSALVYYKVPQAGPRPPIVSNCSSNVTSKVAPGAVTLMGHIDPNSLPTTWHFSYGTTTSFGTNVPSPDGPAITIPTDVSQNINNLGGGTYYFTLVASNSDGTTNCGVNQFTIAAAPPTPPAVTLSASPNPITSGQSTKLTWTVTGNATSCAASSSPTDSQWTTGTNPNISGGTSNTSNLTTTTTYTIACTGPGGTGTQSTTVTVNPVGGQRPTVAMTGLSLGPGGIGGNQILYLTGTVNDHGVSGTVGWFHYIQCGSGADFAANFYSYTGQPQAVATNTSDNTVTLAVNPFSFYYCGYNNPSSFTICAQNSVGYACSAPMSINESGGTSGGGGCTQPPGCPATCGGDNCGGGTLPHPPITITNFTSQGIWNQGPECNSPGNWWNLSWWCRINGTVPNAIPVGCADGVHAWTTCGISWNATAVGNGYDDTSTITCSISSAYGQFFSGPADAGTGSWNTGNVGWIGGGNGNPNGFNLVCSDPYGQTTNPPVTGNFP